MTRRAFNRSMLSKDAKFVFDGERDHVRHDGQPAKLWAWRLTCATCGDWFEQLTPQTGFDAPGFVLGRMRRRCAACISENRVAPFECAEADQ
jgi:hypothetical protein